MAKISMIVNGNPVNANVDPRTLLVQFLRDRDDALARELAGRLDEALLLGGLGAAGAGLGASVLGLLPAAAGSATAPLSAAISAAAFCQCSASRPCGRPSLTQIS